MGHNLFKLQDGYMLNVEDGYDVKQAVSTVLDDLGNVVFKGTIDQAMAFLSNHIKTVEATLQKDVSKDESWFKKLWSEVKNFFKNL